MHALADPAGARKNTKDNTPAVIHYSIVPGNTVEVDVAAKGGGSENKSKILSIFSSGQSESENNLLTTKLQQLNFYAFQTLPSNQRKHLLELKII